MWVPVVYAFPLEFAHVLCKHCLPPGLGRGMSWLIVRPVVHNYSYGFCRFPCPHKGAITSNSLSDFALAKVFTGVLDVTGKDSIYHHTCATLLQFYVLFCFIVFTDTFLVFAHPKQVMKQLHTFSLRQGPVHSRFHASGYVYSQPASGAINHVDPATHFLICEVLQVVIVLQ